MFGAHEEEGLIGAHAPPIKKLPTIIKQFYIYKAKHWKLNRSKE